jgi:hypothetical protein
MIPDRIRRCWGRDWKSHAPKGDIRRQHRMDFPHWRIADVDSFNQDIPAPIRLNEVRAKVRCLAKDALAYRSTPCSKVEQSLPRHVLTGSPVLPVRFVGLTVECSRAGDCDVMFFERVDER